MAAIKLLTNSWNAYTDQNECAKRKDVCVHDLREKKIVFLKRNKSHRQFLLNCCCCCCRCWKWQKLRSSYTKTIYAKKKNMWQLWLWLWRWAREETSEFVAVNRKHMQKSREEREKNWNEQTILFIYVFNINTADGEAVCLRRLNDWC